MAMMTSQPSDEWRDLVMGKVDAVLEKRKITDRAPHRDFRARIQLSAVGALVAAAQARGMSTSAYLRRAGLAFAAYDLDLDLADLLEDEPATRLKGDWPRANRREHGQGHGIWRIGGLE